MKRNMLKLKTKTLFIFKSKSTGIKNRSTDPTTFTSISDIIKTK